MFNWEKLFQNKNIHDQLKQITCNDKEPPWLTFMSSV